MRRLFFQHAAATRLDFFDRNVAYAKIIPRRGYRLIARGKATKERHPGLGMPRKDLSAN
jgi:hypothetical protein